MSTKSEKTRKKSIKRFFGGKKVVDKNGVLVFYWRRGRLYDLKGEEYAPCKRVKKEEISSFGIGYVTDGKFVYSKGKIVWKIESDNFRCIALILLTLLTIDMCALAVLASDCSMASVPEFTVIDTDGEWGASGTINIFGYDKLKPGDKGSYAFMINNPSLIDLKCKIYFTIKNENNAALPPIEYSVITRGKALKQQETENGFSVESVIVKNKDSRILYLDWEWVFDGNDEHDTLAGIEGKDFTFTIKIVAEETSVKNN